MINALTQSEENSSIAKSKLVVENLLKSLSIQRIVYIDDCFEKGVNWVIQHVAVGLSSGKEAQLNPLFIDIDFDEQDFWQQEVRNFWVTLNESSRKVLLDAIQLLNIIPDDKDRKAAEAIAALIPAFVDYQEVSPQQYDRERIEWLDKASTSKKILCLFDLEFKYTPLGEEGVLDGLKMLERDIQHVNARQPSYDGKVLFGIFSHTFKIDQEREKGANLSNDRGIPRTIFLPLSKERRISSSVLAAGLQMLVLNIYTGNIKNIIKSTMSQACAEACTELDKVDVFDFDDMVLKSSFHEGVWEGETLLRLFLLMQRRKALDGLSIVASELNSFFEIARSIAKPRLISHTPADPLKLRRLELYEEGKSLNSVHTPLRAGDIFQLKGGYEYILLCPPCDLMVRSGTEKEAGKGGMPQNELKQVDLFRIKDINQETLKKLSNEQISVLGFLKNYKSQKLGRVSFKEKITIPIEILDLSVLNKDGTCQIDTSNKPIIPVQFHPAWQARHEILITYFEELAKTLQPLEIMLQREGLSVEDQKSTTTSEE